MKRIDFTILGKSTQLVIRKLGRVRIKGQKVWGYCEPPESKPCCIHVDSRLQGEKLLEVVMHECLHRAGWHIDEEFVTQFAKDTAALLTKVGFRDE